MSYPRSEPKLRGSSEDLPYVLCVGGNISRLAIGCAQSARMDGWTECRTEDYPSPLLFQFPLWDEPRDIQTRQLIFFWEWRDTYLNMRERS